jgi:hypothetical protein
MTIRLKDIVKRLAEQGQELRYKIQHKGIGHTARRRDEAQHKHEGRREAGHVKRVRPADFDAKRKKRRLMVARSRKINWRMR